MSVTFAATAPHGQLVENDENHLNMANANFYELATALNLPGRDDWYGSIPAGLLLEKVAAFLARHPATDEGRATTESQAPGGPRFINCGHRPGYLRKRAAELGALALTALHLYGAAGEVVFG